MQIGIQIGLLDQFPDLLLQQRQLGRIEHLDLIIFIDQLRQLGQRAIGVRRCHWRRQMVDDDGMRAPLRLRTLARIIDDERIKQGHVRQQRIGETLLRHPDTFARQPFKSAVLADVDNRIGAPHIAQPAVQRIVMVRRRQVGLVINGVRVHAVAARRLQRHEHIAQFNAGQSQMVVMHIRDTGRRAPLLRHFLLHFQRQVGQPLRILRCRHAPDCMLQLLRREVGIVVGAAVDQLMNQGGAVGRHVAQQITGIAHRLQDRHQRSGCIQADGVTDLRRFAVRIGKNECDAFILVRFPFQLGETGRQTGHAGNTVGHRRIVDRFIRPGGARLERDRHRDNAAIEFGQHHVHRRVERIHAAL